METKLGKNTVIATGSIVTCDDAPIDFIHTEKTGLFTIRLLFKTDPESNKSTVTAESTDPELLILTFLNFYSFLGGGTTQPIHTGTLDGSPLFLNLNWTFFGAPGKQGRAIHYTWFVAPRETANV